MQTDRQTDRQTESSKLTGGQTESKKKTSKSKTVFYKEYSLGAVKNLTASPGYATDE